MGAGVNTGAELVYGGTGGAAPGKPGNRVRYERVDGRGHKLTRPAINPEVVPFLMGGDGAYTFDIAAAATLYQLPFPGDEYIIVCNGNTAFLRFGGAGVVATTAVGGYDVPIADAIYFRCRPPFTHVSFIGNAAAGAISFIHLRNP